MAVEVVYIERRRDMTESRAANYARLRRAVRDAADSDVSVSHYEDVDAERLRDAEAIVLSGSSAPWTNHLEADLDRLGAMVLSAKRPVLGICAGMQLQARFAGGALGPSPRPEHGFLAIDVFDTSDLLRGVSARPVVFQDHTHEIARLPEGFRPLASSADCAVQAFACTDRRWWGTQFHPEESSPEHPAGMQVLRTFFALLG